MADDEHVAKLKEGLHAWNTWREENPDVRPDLSSADLSSADHSATNLSSANLSSANLDFANLSSANLSYANLSSANLSYANLSYVNLSSADLTRASINRDTNFDNVRVDSETKGLGPWIFNPEKYIIREIEFPPEYRQAGLGIMNYFAEVMREKYPDIPAMVQITQDGLTIRMTIETDDGHREIVERTLEEYGLVVAGQRQPAELLSDPVAVMGLQNRLELAQVELRMTRNQLQLAEQQNRNLQGRTTTLEDDVRSLQNTISQAFTQQQDVVHDSLRHSQRLNTRLVSTASQHTSEFTQLFRNLLDRPDAKDAAVQDALATLQQTLDAINERQEASEAERGALIEIVRTLEGKSPTILRQLTDAVSNISAGVAANTISGVLAMYGWMPGSGG